MKHLKTFEGFVNESKSTRINESADDAQNLADDWGAEVLDPVDIKTMEAQPDEVSKFITMNVKKLGSTNQFYLLTKGMVSDDPGLKASGLKWPLFTKLVKDTNFAMAKIDGDEICLFC